MDAGRLQQLEELYHAARYSSPEQRAALLAQADPELRREVESLLAQDSSGDKILDHPPDEWPSESTETVVAVGSQRGPYKIEGVLGKGGMGQVYKARDTRLGRAVALKVVHERFSAHFQREARVISSLNHPHICTLYDVGPDYLVMELVEGETLATRLKKGKLTIDDTLRYGTQIAEALADAHGKGIIHRDLKPGNIMVTKSGVKVLDFGLAKSVQDETLTGSQVVMGTPAYMAPEQREGKECDPRSDIFSLGLALHEMATGRRWEPKSLDGARESAGEAIAGIPRELDKIVARCLRKDPARRFQNMTDLKLALEDLKEESESGATVQPVVAAKPKSRLPLLAAAVAVVLAVPAVWYLLLQSASKPTPPPRAIPLTAYQGSERHPSFSPDGNQVAFDWNGEKQDNYDIYVKLVSGGAPLRLTTNPAEDTYPAWSPDGSQIAFIRTGAGIYLISPLGGQERRLTDANARYLTWMPDGQSLLASIRKDATSMSIFQISMGGEMRRVTSSPATGDVGAGDWYPAVSPDGRTVAFARYTNVSDLYVSPITGGDARRLTNDRREIVGLVWINNREILFSSGRVGGRTLWRIAADGRSQPQPLPGVDGSATDPAITHPARSPARVAYQRTEFDYNIWRMEVSVSENGPARIVTRPAPVIASTRTDTSPQFSPDAKRMVFASDRSGHVEIWVSSSDGSNATQLTTLRSGGSGSSSSAGGGPAWSPDGQKIVFTSAASGNNDIWMVNADGGSSKRLTMEPSNDGRASWSRDGRWIYFRSDRSGAIQIWKIPSVEPYKPAIQVTQNEGRDAIESADGKILYFTKTAKGLWSLPVAGGDETPVLESVPVGCWDVTDKGVYFLSGRLIQFLSFANRKLTRIGEIPKPTDPYRPNFSVTRDNRWIAWTQLDREDSDLMLLENFR